MSEEELEDIFPLLTVSSYTITSDATLDYNCIAWAAGNDDAWWWPHPQYYWPRGVVRTETLEAFQKLFEAMGYQVCESHALEVGFEKVAIYTSPAGVPTHAARQLSDGTWTSKIGKFEDITHQRLKAITGKMYGTVALVLKRPCPDG